MPLNPIASVPFPELTDLYLPLMRSCQLHSFSVLEWQAEFMQTPFLAPLMEKLYLSSITLLSVVGMSNSAMVRGQGWDHGPHFQHCGSRTLRCYVWLTSCQVCLHPCRAVGADSTWFLTLSNLQIGLWCQELILEPLSQSQDPQVHVWACNLGWMSAHAVVVTCRPWTSTVCHLHPTSVLSWKLFWVVLDRNAKPGLVFLCRK